MTKENRVEIIERKTHRSGRRSREHNTRPRAGQRRSAPGEFEPCTAVADAARVLIGRNKRLQEWLSVPARPADRSSRAHTERAAAFNICRPLEI